MRLLVRVGRCLLLATLLAVSAATPGAAQPGERQASVLVLLPGQPGLPTASLISSGIRSTLIGEWSVRISIETEIVDVDRFQTLDAEEQRLRALLPVKYKDRPFDLVITASSSPLRVALRIRDDLFPGTPIIGCAMDERGMRGLSVPPNVTVLTVRLDMDGTVRAALDLLPDTRHVALVGGSAPQDRVVNDLARQAVRDAGRALDLIDLTGLSMVDLMARVAALPEQTIVLVSSYQMDASARRFYGLEIIEPLARVANRPAFNMFEQVLGRGVVGGSVLDFEAVGREAGTLALEVLRGEPLTRPASASTVPSRFRFDARQLARWNIPERRLPAGSEVLYRETSLWEYRWYAALAVGIVAAQAALIAALMLERSTRREAQSRLAERLAFEALVTEIGAVLTVTPPARLEEQVRACLERVVTFLAVDFGALWRPATAGAMFEVIESWSAPGVVAPTMPIDPRRFVYFAEQLQPVGGTLGLARVDDLPSDAATERAVLAAEGIRSLAAVSLHLEERIVGVLAFGTVREERDWPPDLIRQLQILGEYFANPVIRAEDAAALESSAALTAAVLAALPGETAIIDADGTILQTNQAWDIAAQFAPAGTARAMAVGANYLETCRDGTGVPAHIAKQAADGIEGVLRGERHEFWVEYPTSRYGQERWFELRVRRVGRLGGGAAVMHLDVTKRRQDEAAAQQSLSEIAHLDRVAAMGTLASSIAHELNQPLTAMLTNAQAATRLLAASPPDIDEAQACLADMIADDRRASEVLRRMHRMLKKTEVSVASVAVNDVVASTIGLVSNDALIHAVSIEFDAAPALAVVYGDVVQIQQVVLNLLTNAIAAAAGPGRRKVTVWTAAMPSPYVEVGVHDSGPGIPPADLARVFEPFFTTKSEGLGMGLAISRKIVEAHRGQIFAENDPRGGAVLRVHLRTDTPESTTA